MSVFDFFLNKFRDERGFNKQGVHKNGTLFDDEGYDRNGFNSQGFNKNNIYKDGTLFDDEGYDRNGFNHRGFNKNSVHKNGTLFDNDGYNQSGFDKNGLNREGIDRQGYNGQGFNKDGRHENGTFFDEEGYDRNGYNQRGFNGKNIHKNGTLFDDEGYSQAGFDEQGFNREGLDNQGFNKRRFGKDGIHKNGTLFDEEGYDQTGFNKDGFNKERLNRQGFNKLGFAKDGRHKNGTLFDDEGYNQAGFNKDGLNREGLDRQGYNKQGFNKSGYHKNGTLFDSTGYNVAGFNKKGLHRNGTLHDDSGLDKLGFGRNGFNRFGKHKNGTLYDYDGYNREGYNSAGFNKQGYDQAGFDEHGFNRYGQDRQGYNKQGFLKDGLHKNGTLFDDEGYDQKGFNQHGFNKNKIHKNGTLFDDAGYNEQGFNQKGFNQDHIHKNGTPYDDSGFMENGFNRLGFDREGYNRGGYDAEGYNRAGFDENGYDRQGFNQSGFNLAGFDKNGFDQTGFNRKGFDSQGYNRNGFDEHGFDKNGFDQSGFNQQGFDTKGYDREGFDEHGYSREGFDQQGFDAFGFNRAGYDRQGYNQKGEHLDTFKDEPKCEIDSRNLHVATNLSVAEEAMVKRLDKPVELEIEQNVSEEVNLSDEYLPEEDSEMKQVISKDTLTAELVEMVREKTITKKSSFIQFKPPIKHAKTQGEVTMSSLPAEKPMIREQSSSTGHLVQYGQHRQRRSFARINEVLELPNLIEIQTSSYNWLFDEGLREMFQEISPIEDFTGNLSLEFIDYTLGEPKYDVAECKERDVVYAAPLNVKVRLYNKEFNEIKEQDVFMGYLPLMTETGTFIINGVERVIVSQLVRSPSVYFHDRTDKNGKKGFGATVVPNRGAWLEYVTDAKDVVYARIDGTRKLPVTVLLRALGFSTDQSIIDLIGDNEYLRNTLEKDSTESTEEALLEIYERLLPGEPPTVEAAKNLLYSRFFDAKRYDLANVGRYKMNKKLHIKNRLFNQTIAETLVDPDTGRIIVEAGTLLDRRNLDKLIPYLESGVGFRTLNQFGGVIEDDITIQSIKIFAPNDETQKEINVISNAYVDEKVKNITAADVLASVSYVFNLLHGVGNTDDIDHLGNRRLRSVGELLQNQLRIGLSRMERVTRERMSIDDTAAIVPQQLINIRPVVASINEFFGTSQLSQYMDQTNPLAELTHKRRLTVLGPGGLTREHAGLEVRDVHYSHYGRMCPIETPEGPNFGLISSLSSFAKVNKLGFIETPYRRVNPETGQVSDHIDYLTADEEDHYIIAQATSRLNEDCTFKNEEVVGRYRGDNTVFKRELIDYMEVSPKQVVSAATACIPFLENDNPNRALMGVNMQRQAVPLLDPEAPFVGTGMEHIDARDSGAAVIAKYDGIVEHVEARSIHVRRLELVDGEEVKGNLTKYKLQKFVRSNQGTSYNQRPIVKVGDRVRRRDILADGPSMERGELALGRNVLVAFMTWEGFNYEDAIIMSERLVKDDVYTSVHIDEYEAESRDTKLGPEEITRDIPNVGEDECRNLDKRGIVRIGAEVRDGDILVGKVTPKGITELTTEERLLHAIFGEKAREVRDTSLRVPHGANGIVLDVKVFNREDGDELPPGVNQLVRVYIFQKRKIRVGDKMAGRHGNKGVISCILPEEEMPFMPDGTPVDILINPLGVPSRMNIGQVLELHLGMAARNLGVHMATPVFDGANDEDVWETMEEAGMNRDGKTILYDGRSGEPFDNRVSVGIMYMMKLAHMVDDKLHARSTGPYSIVTQQPLGGRAQFGGQRFGEMEVWALEAYGAAHILQEMLTVKSDDVVGRVKTYEAIVKGESLPEPGVPESFKVLIKELQSLGMEVKMLTVNDEEVELQDLDDEDEI